MKIAPSAYSTKNGTAVANSSKGARSLITLVPDPSEEEIPAENATQFSLRSTPANDDSPKYKVTCRILQGTESCRSIILWWLQARQVLHGLNVDAFTAGCPIVEALLGGTAKTLYQAAVEKAKQDLLEQRVAAEADAGRQATIRTNGINHATNLQFILIDMALKDMMTQLMPRCILARVKRFMRREARKPSDMKVRVYFQHLLRLNMEIVPALPPHQANQSLSTDELLDILLFGTPKSWQKEMERQGFDPMDNTTASVVEFMERIEATEDFDALSNEVPAKASKTNKKKSPSGKKSSDKEHGELKYCSHHGKNPSHTSDECFVLHPELREKKPAAKSKTWSRKAAESKAKAKNDLAAFVRKEVAKGVAKATASKKRKTSDGEDSDDDLNAFDLKDFNYKDMDDLKIETDDEEISDEISL